MDQNKTDLIMKFVLERQDVLAECALQIDRDDPLMNDFKPADYKDYSNFFEVTNFDFSLSVEDNDESSNPASQAVNHSLRPTTARIRNMPAPPFARVRSATDSEAQKIASTYPPKFGGASFERLIDRASPTFFMSCCTSKTFDSAVLVKRLSQGEIGGKSLPSQGYLRIEFYKVLITDISWDDGELVKEKCEFTCHSMKLIYRKQDNSGRLQAWAGPVPNGQYSAQWPNPHAEPRPPDMRGGGRRS
jgi:type VI protein secretion system component Hcp